jgi:GH15 family glucan-1,4-alpha-glucosidase
MSEQINPTTGEPASVMPLIWSHAEFINTVLDITNSSQ